MLTRFANEPKQKTPPEFPRGVFRKDLMNPSNRQHNVEFVFDLDLGCVRCVHTFDELLLQVHKQLVFCRGFHHVRDFRPCHRDQVFLVRLVGLFHHVHLFHRVFRHDLGNLADPLVHEDHVRRGSLGVPLDRVVHSEVGVGYNSYC